MKTKYMVALAALILSVVMVRADNPSRLKVLPRGNAVFKVIYTGDGEVLITIKNRFDEVVFEEYMKSRDGFILPLNLSRMSPGRYIIEVWDGREKYSQVVYTNVSSKTHEGVPFSVHVSRLSSSRYLFSLKNNSNPPASLRVENASGELLAEYTFTEPEVAMVISLREFSGRPVFVVRNAAYSVVIRK